MGLVGIAVLGVLGLLLAGMGGLDVPDKADKGCLFKGLRSISEGLQKACYQGFKL